MLPRVVLATPEYHGSFSSVMKLMIENLGFPSVLEGKSVVHFSVWPEGRSAPSSPWSSYEAYAPTSVRSFFPDPSP